MQGQPANRPRFRIVFSPQPPMIQPPELAFAAFAAVMGPKHRRTQEMLVKLAFAQVLPAPCALHMCRWLPRQLQS